MNIVDAMVSHHEQLRNLFRQSENDPSVFEQYIQHFVVHHTMEGKYFYDFLEKSDRPLTMPWRRLTSITSSN